MDENGGRRPRGRRLMTVVAVAGALAVVPAGVALAGGSGGSDDGSSAGGTRSVQSTAPDRQDRDRGGGDRGDCPEKRGGGSGSTQL
jgi:hypothetical protein